MFNCNEQLMKFDVTQFVRYFVRSLVTKELFLKPKEARKFQGCFKEVSRQFLGSLKVVSRVFQES